MENFMINHITKALSLLFVLAFISACCSNNVKEFRPDPMDANRYKTKLKEKIHVNEVTMPEGNKNSIMCRMAGNIYLPQKNTYSKYVERALKSTLMSLDKLSEAATPSNDLSVKLTKVDFSSVAGEWYINGDVNFGGRSIGFVNSVTEFGTSFDAGSACRNVAEAFEKAVSDFVNKVLENVSNQ